MSTGQLERDDDTDPDPEECDHPLEHRNVYGNPDPYGARHGSEWDGVSESFKMDAKCELCGAKADVHYNLNYEKSTPP